MEAGEFRSDLFFRLNVIELAMPPLSERDGDIPLLAQHFLKEITREWDTPAPGISRDAMAQLETHGFSGNVRELVNILQRAVTMAEGDEIQPDDLMLEQGAVSAVERGDSAMSGVGVPMPDRLGDQSLDTFMEDIERQALQEALEKARWNKTRAAELLGISFRSLRYKLKKYDID